MEVEMLRVVLNGFELEGSEDSELHLYANMNVNGLYTLGYDIERVPSDIHIKIPEGFDMAGAKFCQVLRGYDKLGTFEVLDFQEDEYVCTIAFAPTKRDIEKTWERALKTCKAPMPYTRTFAITRSKD